MCAEVQGGGRIKTSPPCFPPLFREGVSCPPRPLHSTFISLQAESRAEAIPGRLALAAPHPISFQLLAGGLAGLEEGRGQCHPRQGVSPLPPAFLSTSAEELSLQPHPRGNRTPPGRHQRLPSLPRPGKRQPHSSWPDPAAGRRGRPGHRQSATGQKGPPPPGSHSPPSSPCRGAPLSVNERSSGFGFGSLPRQGLSAT
jgi:hypothetical protein